jgi:predicted nucleic acid-binding protein
VALIVADTDVLIDFLAGRGEAASVERELERGALATTVISRFELLSGARGRRAESAVRTLLEAMPCLPLAAPAADRAAAVRRALETEGRPIGMADSLIAGVVLEQGAALLTRNRSHFERVTGLRLVE